MKESDNLPSIILINKYIEKYRIYYSPHNNKTFYVEKNGLISTGRLKEIIIEEIKNYDSSDYINGFIYDDKEYWFDKNTRISLLHSIEIVSKVSNTFKLWLDNISIDINCNTLINFLNNLEIYAIETKNITNQHLNNVNNIDDRNQLLNYNITENYPNKITLNIKCMNNNPNYIGFVNNKADIYLIKNCFVGAIIEVISEGKYYKVTSIDWKTKQVLAFEDSDEEFISILNKNKEAVKTLISNIKNEYNSNLNNLDNNGKIIPGNYKLGTVSEIKLIDNDDNNLIADSFNELNIYFKTPSTSSVSISYKTLDLHWIDDDYPVNLDPDTNYVISIVNNIGVYGKYLN